MARVVKKSLQQAEPELSEVYQKIEKKFGFDFFLIRSASNVGGSFDMLFGCSSDRLRPRKTFSKLWQNFSKFWPKSVFFQNLNISY